MRRFSLIAVLLLSSISAFAATDADHFAAGRAAMRNREAEKAVEAFEKAIAVKPTAEYYYWLGRAYGDMAMKASVFKQPGLAKKTKAAFDKAVQLDPDHIEARFALIDYYLIAPGIMGGSVEKAREQAAELKKRDALQGHRALSRVLMKEKKPDLARKEMVDAVREQPTAAPPHYYLGSFYSNEKNYAQAMHEFEMAARLDPNYMRAYFRIGVTAALANTAHARGEEALKKYLAYKPNETDEPSLASAWYWLGNLYEKQGRKADAKQSFLQAQKLAPESKDVKEAIKRVS
jgi:tetratricopeptide (TPR) repeat protein